MATPIQGVPPTAQPWARSVEDRMGKAERKLGILDTAFGGVPDLDKTVFSEFNTGQNLAVGTNGRVEPTAPVKVRFVSSTGLFEVTVSLAGLVRDGAILGAGFESTEEPYEVSYDLPKYGVAFSAAPAQTTWAVNSQSYSTVISTRPGVQELSMYLYGVCNQGPNSAAYVKRARLSVKAV
ncbi:hypothetical protein [uncultured Arthrobacter sp.]|uniref:hypothetical protein n=1 Tax=uncultured Arthrobacter sp. TaxID=114050 RepID=UPI0032162C51